VGTKLISGDGSPSFGGVYKLAADYSSGSEVPKIKVSEDPEKITNPGDKKVLRIYDKTTGKIKADLICRVREGFSSAEPLVLMNETHDWKRITLKRNSYEMRELMVPIYQKGRLVYNSPDAMSIQKYARQELATLWPQYRDLVNPEMMKVDLSDDLYNLKKSMIFETRSKLE
jgi:nicotinate phosphoribosyltransferase